MTPEDFHKVMVQQNREIKELKRTSIGKVKPMQLFRRSSQHRVQLRKSLKKHQFSTTTNSQDSREMTQKNSRGNS